MDGDDEFGDLYADVLHPFQPPPHPPLRSIDLNLRSHEQDAAEEEPNPTSVARVSDATASKPSTTPSHHDAISDDDKDMMMKFNIEEPDSTPAIPGLGTATIGGGYGGGQGDDWDSDDSEGDLQIVLNDNNNMMMGADRRARMG